MVGPGPPQCLFVESEPHTDYRVCGVVADGGGALPVQVYLEKTQSLHVIHSFFFPRNKVIETLHCASWQGFSDCECWWSKTDIYLLDSQPSWEEQ